MRILRRLAERLRRRSSFRDRQLHGDLRAALRAIPLGRLGAGRRQIVLGLDRPAEGSARIDDERREIVADERLCRDMTKTVELDATATASYFLHLKSGAAILSRIAFR